MDDSLINPLFDYAVLSSSDKSKLIYFEGELTRCQKRVSVELIRFGEILHDAQQTIAHHGDGVFRVWLESSGVSVGSAHRAIGAYQEFGDCSNLEQFEVSAMYALTNNQDAKKKALRLADSGVKVTHSMAKRLIEESEPKPSNGGSPAGTSEPDRDSESEDGGTESGGQDAQQESSPRPPRKGTEASGGSSKQRTPAEEFKIQKSKTIKTAEALVRAFDDLNELRKSSVHEKTIRECQALIERARNWGH